jgi:hypothetical protein
MTVTDGLDQIKPGDKTTKIRAAVLTQIVKPKMAWGHFIKKADGKKVFVRCHSVRDNKHVITKKAACCAKLNDDDDQKAQLNFAAPAIKYGNTDAAGAFLADEGGKALPIKWSLGWLKLSRAGYKQISELILEGESAHDFDFTMAYRDNGVGFEFKRKSKGLPRYMANPDLAKEVIAEATEKLSDGKLLTKKLGKVISEVDMKALLSGAAATSTKNTQVDNTDDL